jgi:hypothetical protein
MAYKRAPIWLLWFLGLWLQIADSIITMAVIHASNSEAELNPLMKAIIDDWGIAGMVYFKTSIFILLALLICVSRLVNATRAQRLMFNAIALTDGFMLANVIWGAYCYQTVT